MCNLSDAHANSTQNGHLSLARVDKFKPAQLVVKSIDIKKDMLEEMLSHVSLHVTAAMFVFPP